MILVLMSLSALLSAPASLSAGSIDSIKTRAEQGDAEAQFVLGMAYIEGEEVRKDRDKALECLRKAAEKDRRAQLVLGAILAPAEGLRWYLKAADGGSTAAQYRLGRMYRDGKVLPKDAAEAVTWLSKAAEQGNVAAQLELSRMYLFGDGVAEDRCLARRWFDMAFGKYDDEAWGQARYFYCDFTTVEKASRGDAKAQFFLGLLSADWRSDCGLVPKEVKAVTWFRRAAEQGMVPAMTELGIEYALRDAALRKDGARKAAYNPEDCAEGLRWLHLADERQDPAAAWTLGVMYRNGSCVPQSHAEAAKWFRKAADRGLAKAQHALYGISRRGEGVPKDFEEAIRWLFVAAEHGLEKDVPK